MSSDRSASPKPPPKSGSPGTPAERAPAKGTSPPQKPPLPESAVTFTKAAALWGSLILGFLILIVLLIFIAQNTTSTEFTFLGWHWSQPLGVAIMFAAVAGGLLAVAVGAVRIYQLRRAAKKNLKAGL
ncbi:MAG: lipopolysaccharide assembly protein LapA domain-containing protein [Actinomycetia bacterium]|nr:lipopolysaccharide assembly protein LapA domain-containing protein [Actinomycetes bacterium]MCH9767473.1 lipopolysaccharide assembly protein LapA domain-containing protein [Actinomycetes bacterium]